MEEQKIYKLTDEEYKLFEQTTKTISCPNLSSHDCSICPMNININRCYPKEPEYRCLLAMMRDKLITIKTTKEDET